MISGALHSVISTDAFPFLVIRQRETRRRGAGGRGEVAIVGGSETYTDNVRDGFVRGTRAAGVARFSAEETGRRKRVPASENQDPYVQERPRTQ